MWRTSDEVAALIDSGSIRTTAKIDVVAPDGTLLDTAHPLQGSGSVTYDETAQDRSALTFTVADESGRYVAARPGDLLHPLTGNELWPYKGVWRPTINDWEWIPFGVFRPGKPAHKDDGVSQQTTITGYDRLGEVSNRQWTEPFVAAGGLSVEDAIWLMLLDRWGTTKPALPTPNFVATGVTIPPGTMFGVQLTSSGAQAMPGSQGGTLGDAASDIIQLALSAGCAFWFDRQGIPTLQFVQQPGSAPVTVQRVTGTRQAPTSLEFDVDVSTFRNGVKVVGTGATVTNTDGSTSPGPIVVGEAYSADPTYGPFGSRQLGRRAEVIVDATCSTADQAQASAQARLPFYLTQLNSTSYEAFSDPRTDAGDAGRLARAELRVDDVYIVQAVTHNFDPGPMQVTNRPAAVLLV